MKNDFGKLKRKIFLWIILSAVLALLLCWMIMVVLVDGFLQAPFANAFISVCRNLLPMSDAQAHFVYQKLFQDYKVYWTVLIFFVVILFIIYRTLSYFTRYFNEVSRGMDKLVEESEDEIILSPEMDFMEKKLNKVKSTLKKRSRDAQEAEQRKNDLVVYLAHDIKTPLTSVIGYLNLLDEAPDMPMEQKAKYVSITLKKAYRLEQLINEFFEITRFNLQTIVLDKEDINLPYMLMQMADEFYPILAPQCKNIVLNADENLYVYGDADKLARVFNNIIKNAIAYSFDNSTINITAKRHDGNIIIKFINQGKTIPQQKLSSIFEKFYRLDDSRSTNTGGAGLGLAIAKEIVTAHGGSISAESSESCTVFTIVLPE